MNRRLKALTITEQRRPTRGLGGSRSLYSILWHALKRLGDRSQGADAAALHSARSAESGLANVALKLWALEQFISAEEDRADSPAMLHELVEDLLEEARRVNLEWLDFDGARWSPGFRSLADAHTAVPQPGLVQPVVLKTLAPAVRFDGRLIARGRVAIGQPAVPPSGHEQGGPEVPRRIRDEMRRH